MELPTGSQDYISVRKHIHKLANRSPGYPPAKQPGMQNKTYCKNANSPTLKIVRILQLASNSKHVPIKLPYGML
eukprot:5740671-Karenia_brevis.AAC.1